MISVLGRRRGKPLCILQISSFVFKFGPNHQSFVLTFFIWDRFEPESDFLEAIKAIDGVSQVETQTITNVEVR